MARALRTSRPPLPRFAVAWFPRLRELDRVEEFRRRHDPMAPHIPAHLWLVFAFPTALSELQVHTHVQRIVSRWPPIPVTFRSVRLFANEFIFLMASRGATAVTALHDKLYTRSLAPHLRRDLPYEPHITLARNPDLAKLELAMAEADEVFGRELGDVIREVSLLAVDQNGKIERLKEIALNTA